ncbi:hypothetical protein ENHAE0001_0976 [Enhydrobacter aerosaccus SK60]|nr:hypothetical protein ENHAE0001_0976 [Enhydrobacter aerosaccus SK60]
MHDPHPVDKKLMQYHHINPNFNPVNLTLYLVVLSSLTKF